VRESEQRLARGEYGLAVSEAYHRVVLDLQKAYGLSLPAQWTHREFLAQYLRDDMGILNSEVARLYRLYEPVRYGSESDWTRGDLLDVLRKIYSEPPMRDLYPSARPTPSVVWNPADRSRAVRPDVEGLPPPGG
jgi:hypothetical protein